LILPAGRIGLAGSGSWGWISPGNLEAILAALVVFAASAAPLTPALLAGTVSLSIGLSTGFSLF